MCHVTQRSDHHHNAPVPSALVGIAAALKSHVQGMRAALGQCQPHSSIQAEALVSFKHISKLFGIVWELPGGQLRIASLHRGFKDSTIHVHGSCTEVRGGPLRVSL